MNATAHSCAWFVDLRVLLFLSISGFGRSASERSLGKSAPSPPGVRVGFGCGTAGCGPRNFFLGSLTVSSLVTVAVLRTRGWFRLASQFVGRIYNKRIQFV